MYHVMSRYTYSHCVILRHNLPAPDYSAVRLRRLATSTKIGSRSSALGATITGLTSILASSYVFPSDWWLCIRCIYDE